MGNSMQIERKALYNLLRMNWLNDPQMDVETWQVEDYRALTLEDLFHRLSQKGFYLEKTSFIAYANECDTPEELTENFIEDEVSSAKEQDQIYLIIFELWRRLVPEKPCLSVFCDELDHQIYLHDKGESSSERLQDTLTELQVILDEHADRGIDPFEAFQAVTAGCANDIETFLYDFVSEQIDTNNFLYAADLLDAFTPYIEEKKWFTFLRSRLLTASDDPTSNQILKELIQNHIKDRDLEFNLEILASMVQQGNASLFYHLTEKTIPLLKTEGDFQDLLTLCSDFHHFLDNEEEEKKLQDLLKSRSKNHLEANFNEKEAAVTSLKRMISQMSTSNG